MCESFVCIFLCKVKTTTLQDAAVDVPKHQGWACERFLKIADRIMQLPARCNAIHI